jgi:hypothetical protein
MEPPIGNRTDDLRITRVFPCVAHELKVRPSFTFAGGDCCLFTGVRGHAGGTARTSDASLVGAYFGAVVPPDLLVSLTVRHHD